MGRSIYRGLTGTCALLMAGALASQGCSANEDGASSAVDGASAQAGIPAGALQPGVGDADASGGAAPGPAETPTASDSTGTAPVAPAAQAGASSSTDDMPGPASADSMPADVPAMRPPTNMPPSDSGAATPTSGAMLSSGCGMADAPADGPQQIDVDGMAREFVLAVPDAYDPNTAYKLVFAWHGLGGTGEGIARRGYYGLERMANGSTIFVAAQGLDTSNSVGSGPGWDNMGGRDVAFTAAMLEWVRSRYCIDESRIFSVGMSYGGIMSNTVGCALGDDFRAIAPMAGLGPRGNCTGQVATWITHGNEDTVVPYASGERSRDSWVAANHCDGAAESVGSDGCVAYQGCDDGYPVQWCEFTGGHTVPSFAAAAVWEFFSQF